MLRRPLQLPARAPPVADRAGSVSGAARSVTVYDNARNAFPRFIERRTITVYDNARNAFPRFTERRSVTVYDNARNAFPRFTERRTITVYQPVPRLGAPPQPDPRPCTIAQHERVLAQGKMLPRQDPPLHGGVRRSRGQELLP